MNLHRELALALILFCSGLLCWTMIVHLMATHLQVPALA